MFGHRGAPLADGVAYAPDDDGQRKTTDQSRPRRLIAQGCIQAVARVPSDMANAADEVMKERPGENEQDEAAEERLDELGKCRERRGVRRGGEEKPGEQQDADVKGGAADP